MYVPRQILAWPRRVLRLAFVPLRAAIGGVQKHVAVGESGEARPKLTVAPSLRYLSGMGATLGARAWHPSLGGHGEQLALAAEIGLDPVP
jgi:hypothetical protein